MIIIDFQIDNDNIVEMISLKIFKLGGEVQLLN